jgi:hypothetical protein
MVADTKDKQFRDRETMNRMFDWWNEGLRAAWDTGRRTQETWVRAFTEAAQDDFQNTAENEENAFYRRARRVWDAAFDAVRTNADAFGEATMRGMENYTSFFQSLVPEISAGRPAQKTAKTTP